MFIGGGYGRRTLRRQKYVEDALLVSKAIRKPVKVIWTREDDLRYGMYRPMSFQRLQASTDASGNLTGLSHCVVGDGGGAC